MADIRIKDLATTAASTASDDFVAVDGSANGTRKLNAYSPTFGGNVVATGTLTVNSTTDSSSKDTGAIITEGGLGVEKSATIGGNLTVSGTGSFTTADAQQTLRIKGATGMLRVAGYVDSTNGSVIYSLNNAENAYIPLSVNASEMFLAIAGTPKLTIGTTGNTTLAGNLTVSGTGNSTIAGPVGIKTTPESWYVTGAGGAGAVLQVGGSLGLYNYNDPATANYQARLYCNAYLSSSGLDKYINTGIATKFEQVTGTFYWQRASGTAGNNVTWTQVMTLADNGNLLLGTTVDGGQKLQVNGTGIFQGTLTVSGGQLIATSTTGSNSSDNLRVGDTGSGTTYFKIGRNQSTGNLDFEPAQGSSYGYNFKGGDATFAGTVTASGAGGLILNATDAIFKTVDSVSKRPTILAGVTESAGTYTARSTTPVLAKAAGDIGVYVIYADSGKTVGNTYTPTAQLTVSTTSTALAGALKLNNAYVAGAPTATGYVTIQDSAGNTYKVLVGT